MVLLVKGIHGDGMRQQNPSAVGPVAQPVWDSSQPSKEGRLKGILHQNGQVESQSPQIVA